MDIDKHPAIPGQMGIQSIPAVIAFVNGQPADGFLGALPGEPGHRLHRAHHQGQARRRGAGSAQGRRRGARGRRCRRARPSSTREVLREEPSSVPALAGLARAYVRDRRARAGEADARAGAGSQAQRCRGRGRARRARSRRAGASRSARSASSNKKSPPIRSTIRRASISRSRSTPRASAQEAAEHLLEIVKRDRKWNEDGARKQLVQFFEAWGPTDEATVDGPQAAVVDPVLRDVVRDCVAIAARTSRMESDDADERGLSRARRPAGRDPGVSAAGRAAAAARADAAQHFRAALSGDDRRRAGATAIG